MTFLNNEVIVTKRVAFIVILGFLLIPIGCAETVSVPIPEPASTDTPDSTPTISESSITDSETVSETESPQEETPVKTPTAQTTTQESTYNKNTKDEDGEPALLDALRRNCQITKGSSNFDKSGLAVGEPAVNFTLKDINNKELRLSQFLAEKPVVMVFGSFT